MGGGMGDASVGVPSAPCAPCWPRHACTACSGLPLSQPRHRHGVTAHAKGLVGLHSSNSAGAGGGPGGALAAHRSGSPVRLRHQRASCRPYGRARPIGRKHAWPCIQHAHLATCKSQPAHPQRTRADGPCSAGQLPAHSLCRRCPRRSHRSSGRCRPRTRSGPGTCGRSRHTGPRPTGCRRSTSCGGAGRRAEEEVGGCWPSSVGIRA